MSLRELLNSLAIFLGAVLAPQALAGPPPEIFPAMIDRNDAKTYYNGDQFSDVSAASFMVGTFKNTAGDWNFRTFVFRENKLVRSEVITKDGKPALLGGAHKLLFAQRFANDTAKCLDCATQQLVYIYQVNSAGLDSFRKVRLVYFNLTENGVVQFSHSDLYPRLGERENVVGVFDFDRNGDYDLITFDKTRRQFLLYLAGEPLPRAVNLGDGILLAADDDLQAELTNFIGGNRPVLAVRFRKSANREAGALDFYKLDYVSDTCYATKLSPPLGDESAPVIGPEYGRVYFGNVDGKTYPKEVVSRIAESGSLQISKFNFELFDRSQAAKQLVKIFEGDEAKISKNTCRVAFVNGALAGGGDADLNGCLDRCFSSVFTASGAPKFGASCDFGGSNILPYVKRSLRLAEQKQVSGVDESGNINGVFQSADQKNLRFLWRHRTTGEMKIYKITHQGAQEVPGVKLPRVPYEGPASISLPTPLSYFELE